jgi:hypothetical protein
MRSGTAAAIALAAALGGCAGTKDDGRGGGAGGGGVERGDGGGAVDAAGEKPALRAFLRASDVDLVTGRPWRGELTYRNYGDGKATTIPSALAVVRTNGGFAGGAAWDWAFGYPDEPHASAAERWELSADGFTFRGQEITGRAELSDGAVRVLTKIEGEDDGRPATLRYEYEFHRDRCSLRKLVRFTGETEFFERHRYRWSR